MPRLSRPEKKRLAQEKERRERLLKERQEWANRRANFEENHHRSSNYSGSNYGSRNHYYREDYDDEDDDYDDEELVFCKILEFFAITFIFLI